MSERQKQPELLCDTLNSLATLLDTVDIQVAQGRCHPNVPDANRINPHQPTTSRVRCDRIVRKHETAKAPHRTMQRPIAFHSLNAIGDNEVNRDGHREFDDTVVDALPVQYVLRPA